MMRRESDDLLGKVASNPRLQAVTPSRRTCLAGRLVRAVPHQQPWLAGSSARFLRAALPLLRPPLPPEHLRLRSCPHESGLDADAGAGAGRDGDVEAALVVSPPKPFGTFRPHQRNRCDSSTRHCSLLVLACPVGQMDYRSRWCFHCRYRDHLRWHCRSR
jgi:hypothetical protein